VLIGEEIAGALALGDVVREESREAIDRLKEMGVRVMMITGDSNTVAQAVAEELQLDDFFAEVLPNDKGKEIRKLREQGLAVAMVGDGINDAPALAEADVGIAIGAGTDVAMETADIVLVNSDPRDVLHLVSLSRGTYRKMVQNLWWASGYNIVAIPLAAGVAAPLGIILPPAVGALVMSVSTVIVAINSRWLKMPTAGSEGQATRSGREERQR
jgi:Cu2+-exporting ATPase